MYPGQLTKEEQLEYEKLSKHISRFVLYCELVREHNKKPENKNNKQEIDYSRNLPDEGYFRWNDLRVIAWS